MEGTCEHGVADMRGYMEGTCEHGVGGVGGGTCNGRGSGILPLDGEMRVGRY